MTDREPARPTSRCVGKLKRAARRVIRLALRVRRADAEIVLAELLELAPGGRRGARRRRRRRRVRRLRRARRAARAARPAGRGRRRARRGRRRPRSPTTGPSAGASSTARSTVGGRAARAPPWHATPSATARRSRSSSTPAQAFGTGAHATTRLCLELLLDAASRAAPLVDLGCGSGVLAIAAAKLGWAPVLGVDHDAASRRGDRARTRASTASTVDVAPPRPAARRPGAGRADGARQPAAPAAAARRRRRLRRAGAARARSPAACSRTRPTRSPRRSPPTACASRRGATEGEWAALLLAPPLAPGVPQRAR